jgi:hypothetical protein
MNCCDGVSKRPEPPRLREDRVIKTAAADSGFENSNMGTVSDGTELGTTSYTGWTLSV